MLHCLAWVLNDKHKTGQMFYSALPWLCPCKSPLFTWRSTRSFQLPFFSPSPFFISIEKCNLSSGTIDHCCLMPKHNTKLYFLLFSFHQYGNLWQKRGGKTLQRQRYILWVISKPARTLPLVSLLQFVVSRTHQALGCDHRGQPCKSSAKHITLHSQYSHCGLGQGAHQSCDASDLTLHIRLHGGFQIPFCFHCLALWAWLFPSLREPATDTSMVRHCQ